MGLVVSDFFWKPIFVPHDQLMQPAGMVWKFLVVDHPGIIPVKFGKIQWAVSEEMLKLKLTDIFTNDRQQWAITAKCAQVS